MSSTRNRRRNWRGRRRIAVVELPPDGSHKDEPALIVTKDQVKAWMAAAGFTPKQEFDGLTGKWFIVYGRS